MSSALPLRRAPLPTAVVLHGSGVVGGAYTEWVHHFNTCQQCQREDWFAPVDVTTYCQEGQHLFAQWGRAAMTSHRIF